MCAGAADAKPAAAAAAGTASKEVIPAAPVLGPGEKNEAQKRAERANRFGTATTAAAATGSPAQADAASSNGGGGRRNKKARTESGSGGGGKAAVKPADVKATMTTGLRAAR